MVLPLVGVVIPTYNRGHQVTDAVESALAQEGVRVDVVVVDDGSTDDTAAVIAARARGWGDALRYVQVPNGERSRARNRGLAEVGGDFIAFLDSDDIWEPTHLATAVDAMAGGAVLAVADYGLIAPDREVLVDRVVRPNVDEVHLLAELCRKSIILHPSEVVLRRTSLDEEPFDPEIPGAEDWALWVELAERGAFAATRRRTTWLRINKDGTFGSPSAFGRSLVLAGEKVVASGAPARAGVAASEVRAVCRMNASYAHVLNGRRARGVVLLGSAAAVRPRALLTWSWWAALARAGVPARAAAWVRRQRRGGLGRIVEPTGGRRPAHGDEP